MGWSPCDSAINSTEIVIFYYLEISTKTVVVFYETPTPILTGLASSCKPSKWPVAKRRSRHDVAAADSRDKYLKQPLLCSGTGGPLIVRFLGPRKNRSNGNPYY